MKYGGGFTVAKFVINTFNFHNLRFDEKTVLNFYNCTEMLDWGFDIKTVKLVIKELETSNIVITPKTLSKIFSGLNCRVLKHIQLELHPQLSDMSKNEKERLVKSFVQFLLK